MWSHYTALLKCTVPRRWSSPGQTHQQHDVTMDHAKESERSNNRSRYTSRRGQAEDLVTEETEPSNQSNYLYESHSRHQYNYSNWSATKQRTENETLQSRRKRLHKKSTKNVRLEPTKGKQRENKDRIAFKRNQKEEAQTRQIWEHNTKTKGNEKTKT